MSEFQPPYRIPLLEIYLDMCPTWYSLTNFNNAVPIKICYEMMYKVDVAYK